MYKSRYDGCSRRKEQLAEKNRNLTIFWLLFFFFFLQLARMQRVKLRADRNSNGQQFSL